MNRIRQIQAAHNALTGTTFPLIRKQAAKPKVKIKRKRLHRHLTLQLRFLQGALADLASARDIAKKMIEKLEQSE